MKAFFQKALLGGITVLLPIGLLAMIFNWIFVKTTGLIQPITNILMKYGFPEILSDFIVLSLLIVISFLIGLIEMTTLGRFLLAKIDSYVLKRLPGYKLIKEVVIQFFGENKMLFQKVGIARLFDNETEVIVFITDETEDRYSVFMPTGPNPTSGNIYILKKNQVDIIDDASIELTSKAIISCGAGSSYLLKLRKNKLFN